MSSKLNLSRRALVLSGVAAAVAPAFAESLYPNKPLRLVIPIQAGGIVDTTMRYLGEKLTGSLGQPVVVDNKPGGNYVIAVNTVASAPPDGYSILGFHAGLVATQAALKNYDLLDLFRPVAMVGATPYMLAVGANSPYKSMGELIQAAKQQPNAINYGTPGLGSIEHLKSLELEAAAGFRAVAVPHKGGPDLVVSMIRGDSQFAILPVGLLAPYEKKGQLRFLMAIDDERNPGFPEVPSIKDVGVNIKPLLTWLGLAVRKGTPQAIVQRLHSEANAAMASADIRSRLEGAYIRPMTKDAPEQFGAFIKDELALYSSIVANSNVKFR